MIKDFANSFKEYFEKDETMIETYSLQNGIYFLYTQDGKYVDMLNVDKDTENTSDIYEYFACRDYYSNCFGANKCIPNNYAETVDGKEYKMMKKIFSNNYLTIFFKNKSLQDFTGNTEVENAMPIEVFKRGIKQYYAQIKVSMNEVTNSKEELFSDLKDKLISEEKIDKIEALTDTVMDDVAIRIKEIKDIKKEVWVKIFFEGTQEEYMEASTVYSKLKIFNKEELMTKYSEDIYGINNYNYGSNSKKPYLELKTTPYKMSLTAYEEEKIIANMYTWILKNVTTKPDVIIPLSYQFKGNLEDMAYVGAPAYLIRATNDNGFAKVEECEYLNSYSDKVKRFECKNYINSVPLKDFDINTEYKSEIESFVSKVWFSGYLKSAYYDYDRNVKSGRGLTNWKKNMLKLYARVFKEFFKKENSKSLKSKLNTIGYEITLNYLIDELVEKKTSNAIKSMNLWIALDKYIGNKERSISMEIEEIKLKAKNIIESNGKIEDAQIYYYFIGQITYYLINKSKASKLKQNLFEPILRSNSNTKMKRSLISLYEKYKYELWVKDQKFNNIFSQLVGIDDEKYNIKDYKNTVIFGLLSNNLLLEKKEKGGKEDGEEE